MRGRPQDGQRAAASKRVRQSRHRLGIGENPGTWYRQGWHSAYMRGMTQETDIAGQGFAGAKLALFLGDHLAIILRDNIPDIPWPGHLDLPGGAREGTESPQDCVLRETREELGLTIAPRHLRWGQRFIGRAGAVWFFAAHLPKARAHDVVFGNEGQGWRLMTPAAYLADPLAIPHFQDRLRLYLSLP